MLDLLNYRPLRQFFLFRLNRLMTVVRAATGRAPTEEAIILANARCMTDTVENRVTPTEVHVLPVAMQTFNVYLPREWIDPITQAKIMLPLPYEKGKDDVNATAPAPQDYIFVTGVPSPLIVEAVHCPLILGSHFEILCHIDPRLGLASFKDPTDPWMGLLNASNIENMVPIILPILPSLMQL